MMRSPFFGGAEDLHCRLTETFRRGAVHQDGTNKSTRVRHLFKRLLFILFETDCNRCRVNFVRKTLLAQIALFLCPSPQMVHNRFVLHSCDRVPSCLLEINSLIWSESGHWSWCAFHFAFASVSYCSSTLPTAWFSISLFMLAVGYPWTFWLEI